MAEVPAWRAPDRAQTAHRRVATPTSARNTYRLQPAVTLKDILFLGEVLCTEDQRVTQFCGMGTAERLSKGTEMWTGKDLMHCCSASGETRVKLQLWRSLPLELWGHKNTSSHREERGGCVVSGGGMQ